MMTYDTFININHKTTITMQYTEKHKSIIVALSNEHLTSSEILRKTQKIPHILLT